jgi:hypothetical protein
MLSLSIMGAIILMGQTLPPPRVIAVEKLSLRDVNGNIRAMLFTTPDGSPTLTMADREGEPRIQMIVGQDGTPVIGLQDKKDILRAMLTITAGHPSLSLYDKDGGQRSKLSVDEKGSPALAFWDKGVQDKGIKPRILLTLGPDGSPRLGLGGKDGKPLIALAAVAEQYSLGFFDGKGEPRTLITVDPDGTPSMNILDRNGKVIWKAP